MPKINNIGGEFSLSSLIPFTGSITEESDFFFPQSVNGRARSYFECGTDAICFYIKSYWLRQRSKQLVIWIPIHYCGQTIERIGRILNFEEVRFSFKFFHDNSFLIENDFVEGDVVLWMHFNKYYPIDLDIVESLQVAKAYLIEDYVLAPFDIGKMVGDAAFNSLRKISSLSIAIGYSMDKFLKDDYDSAYNDARKMAALNKSIFELSPNPDLEKSFLQGFKNAEITLEERMQINGPALGDEILFRCTNWRRILDIRKENYQILKANLRINEEYILPGEYQFLMIKISNRDLIRKGFFQENVFPPIHWIDAKSELSLTELSLPIDQRYKASDMKRMAFVTNKLLLENGDKDI